VLTKDFHTSLSSLLGSLLGKYMAMGAKFFFEINAKHLSYPTQKENKRNTSPIEFEFQM
jgi:hypothetical protein